MKRKLILLLTLAFTAMLVACTAPTESAAKPGTVTPSASPTENVEQVVTKLEQEWAAAVVKQDFDTLNRLVADDWFYISWQGETSNKAKDTEIMKSGTYKPVSVNISDVKVRVYGDAAVVTLTQDEKSQFRGKDSSGRYLFTDTWVKRNGKWQVVSSHSTKVEQPKK